MISREEKIWSWYTKTWFPWRKCLIKLIKKETSAQVFFCKFCETFKNTFFMEHIQWHIAKLAFDMWGNCFNRLWYNLETCNSFLKSLRYRCFPVNFEKILRTSFLQNTSGQLLLDFFIHFTVSPPGELIETTLFLFLTCFITAFKRDECHEFKRFSCCCMEAHISRSYHMEFSGVCRLVSTSICTCWISVLHCLAIIHPWNT